MSSDIRIATGFFAHPKTTKLRRRLGDAGILALLRLWAFAGENRTKGVLYELDDEDICIASGWEGEPQLFIETLVELHWLDRAGDKKVLKIHDWETHQPWICTADERSAKARAAAAARWGNATSMPDACGEHAQGNAPILSFPSLPHPSSRPGNHDGGDESPPGKKAIRFTADDQTIAEEMFTSLLDLNPKHRQPDLDKWANTIRLMRERDGRSLDEIRALWTWAHRDQFWGANILCPTKLREKWDQLLIKSKANGAAAGTARPVDNVRTLQPGEYT